MPMQDNDWSKLQIPGIIEWTQTKIALGKGDCARETTLRGFKKQQLQETKLPDAIFQLAGGETEGFILTVSLEVRKNVVLFPEQ